MSIRAFIVNLRRRPDRRMRMESVLPECLVVEWVEAVDARRLDPTDVRVFSSWEIDSSNPWWSRPLKLGEIGCALSHRQCWSRALRQGIAPVAIFEDDAVFDPRFCARVELGVRRLASLDPAWGMCYLGRYPIDPDEPVAGDLVRPGYSHCTYAYMLSAAGLRAVADAHYDEALIPVDEFLPALYCDHPRRDVRARYARRMTAYAFAPSVVGQLPKAVAGSDTEDSAFLAS